MRGSSRLDALVFEVRLALRGLRRDRTYALASVAMLALALALNAAVFTVRDAMLFRGFPLVQRNDRLVYVQERYPASIGVSYADFEEWRRHARTFDAIAFVGVRLIALRDADGRQADLTARTVSANTFRLLGVAPLLGRDFADEDEADGAPATAIISHRFWQRRYGARADVVGSTVRIDGVPTSIIAVMPERFDFTSETTIWMPVVRTPEVLARGATTGSHVAVGRLRDGATPAAALAELEAIDSRLAASYPDTNRGRVPVTYTRAQFISGPEAPMIWNSLWAGSWFVLLIACANLANLTLVRTAGRWRELVTTAALGAGEARMIRRIAVEGALLAGAAVPIAWRLTQWSVRVWSATTASPYQILDYAVDGRTLGYLLAAAALAAALFSIAPIGRVRRLCARGVFKSDWRGLTPRQLSSGLMAVQMTLAIVLLSGAGILLRSVANIVGADSGVRDPQHVVVGLLRLPSQKYPDTARRLAYLDRLEAELRTIPGVDAESVSNGMPVKVSGPRRSFEIEGRAASPDEPLMALSATASPEYFRVLGAPPSAGRAFDAGDRAAAPPVAIVNQRFADTFWPGQSVLGRHLRFTDRNAAGEWRTVVGVVPNIMEGDPLRQQFKPIVYTPFQQEPPARAAFLLARTGLALASVAPAIRSRVQQLDSDVTLEQFSTLEDTFAFDRDSMDFEHSELGKHAMVAPVFAGMALLLSAMGVTAVMTHSVNQRTREIGIRMAIGATARDISRLILRDGTRPVAVGLAAGVVLALAANRVLQSQLVGVSPFDPLVLATAIAMLLAVALASCALPVRRAVSIQPVVALRDE